MNSSTADTQFATASIVRVSEETLTVDLTDGRTISVPVAWYPRLTHASVQERDKWRIIANGRGIHWPDLDEDISVDNLLTGQASGESQASLKQWLEQRGKLKTNP
jgi:Protein of unknown function (DUF2442)